MQLYSTLKDAMANIDKARRVMAFNRRKDVFRIENHRDITGQWRGFRIAMYSGNSGAFCGFY